MAIYLNYLSIEWVSCRVGRNCSCILHSCRKYATPFGIQKMFSVVCLQKTAGQIVHRHTGESCGILRRYIGKGKMSKMLQRYASEIIFLKEQCRTTYSYINFYIGFQYRKTVFSRLSIKFNSLQISIFVLLYMAPEYHI